MAKRTSKKVRKVKKNAKATPAMAAPAAAQISPDDNQESDQAVLSPIASDTVDQLTLEQAQTVGADAVGLTPSAYVYADSEEPALEDVIETYLTPSQLAKVREDALIEKFGRPVRDGREAIVSRIDSKLREL